MSRNPVETLMGAVVLVVAGFFLAFAYNTSSMRTVVGYEIRAPFSKVGGLEIGSDVRISGIKVGSVVDLKLDPLTYEAWVVMSILPDVQLPTDTEGTITSEGLLGGKYVMLTPGRAEEKIPPSGTMTETRDFKTLEELVGDIIFMVTEDSPKP
ncbi:MAG: outer membrane lipid asymmetry maintenance protein MlaD [Alphaproteobacteria bacterium RIFOXYD12_FULL_60_8]|nr:MAG: outer membrane lipid asymmetry maintenance protein MlaD [Alphaproteobacteria bacterium RIFOXYD12_FULL_60_8]